MLDTGRKAVLKDPQGAVLAVWQPRARIGAGRVNDVGCLCMNELATTDIEAARSFYETLFGWTTEEWDTGPDGPPMVLASNGETINASFTTVQCKGALLRTGARASPSSRPRRPQGACASSAGQCSSKPFEIPDGSLAMVLDPDGALFVLFAGQGGPVTFRRTPERRGFPLGAIAQLVDSRK